MHDYATNVFVQNTERLAGNATTDQDMELAGVTRPTSSGSPGSR